jgi:3-hydroxybutyryl-CoA dehydrogenase
MNDIHTIGVLGAGTMGAGIVQVAAEAGLSVLVHDPVDGATERARERVGGFLQRKIEKGQLDANDAADALGRIRPVDSLEALAAADLVVEAIPEELELKRDAFRRLDATSSDAAILATNTSSLSVASIASATRRPERVVGMHFFNPVPVMALVEVVRAPGTADEIVGEIVALARELGKTPAEVNDFPGFVSNRILMPFLNEAAHALQDGVAEAEAIDTIAKLGFNHPMGPLALADLIGLDTCVSILEVLRDGLGDEKYEPCPLLREHVAAGRLGRKTGQGFYSYL